MTSNLSRLRTLLSGGALPLMVGTAVAGILSMGAAPVLSRLYTPESFGVLAAVAAGVTVTTTASNGAIETILPRLRENHRSTALKRGLLFAGISGSGSYALLVILGAGDHASGALSLMANHPWQTSVGVVAFGFTGLAIGSALSRSGYKDVALHRSSSAGVTASLQMMFATFGGSGLAAGFALGQIPSSLLLLRREIKNLPRSTWRSAFRTRLPHETRALTSTSPAALVNGLSTQAIPLLAVSLWGIRFGGLYAIVHRVLSVPTNIVGRSLSEDTISTLARISKGLETKSRLRELIIRRSTVLALSSTLALTGLSLVGERTFVLAFGSEWGDAGILIPFIAPLYVGQLLASPIARALPILGMELQQLTWDLVRLAGLVAIGSLLYVLEAEPQIGLLALSLWLFGLYCIQMLLATKCLK